MLSAGCVGCRYAATTEDMDHTLPKLRDAERRSPLPDFAAAAAAVRDRGGGSASVAAHPAAPGESTAAWRRLLGGRARAASEPPGPAEEEPAWRRSWLERQAAASEASPEERFTVLFPEVVK